jgi:transcriptional antiterminator NusG
VSSQPDSAADNTPEVVSDPGADNPEAGLPQVAEDSSPVDGDSAPQTTDQDEPTAEPAAEAIGDAVETDEGAPEEQTVTEEEATEEEATEEEATEEEATEEEATEEEATEEEATEEEATEEVQEETEEEEESDEATKQWYILKVQVNRENGIRDALERRTKITGLEEFIGDVVVPTEEIAEFNKAGKRRIVKKKLFPGYIMVHMIINDDTWFLVRETPGIGDFTGAGGKPTPMDALEVDRILKTSEEIDDGDQQVKTAIPFKTGDRVRVKDGYFLNFEGEVEGVDEANGRVTVMINIFGRSTPVELEHWQIEDV